MASSVFKERENRRMLPGVPAIQRRLQRLSNSLKTTRDCASTTEVGQNLGEEISKSIIKLRLLYIYKCPYISIYRDTRHLPVQYAIERMFEKR